MKEKLTAFHTIGIVGLGLMGGSLAKAISANTNCHVCGKDINPQVVQAAIADGAICGELKDLSVCDLLIIALFPRAAIKCIAQCVPQMRRGTVIMDICGVKEAVVQQAERLCAPHGIHFVGGHPMAGKENWGYKNASAELFRHASLILTPHQVGEGIVEQLQQFALQIGFHSTVITTPENHDRMISYTSQLAHVLSNAYIKNPLCMEFKGYTGGSFQDLTRVAKLNPVMWSELFMLNRENLINDIGILIAHLSQYKGALETRDEAALTDLLAAGSYLKEQLLK